MLRFIFLSVEQLRAKSGKTMVALSVMAGHRKFLQRMGQWVHMAANFSSPGFA
jgi:hypothetical protein